MRVAQAQPKTLDLDAFLFHVRRRVESGCSIGEGVRRVLKRHTLSPELEAEALYRGLTEIAADHLNRGERDRIARAVVVRMRSVEPTVTSVVVRSELRDWPVWTVAGKRRLEECTPDEVEAEIAHLERTMEGLRRRRDVLARVVAAARAAGVSLVGDLPDEVLDGCIVSEEEV
jgi:hypothetical protein